MLPAVLLLYEGWRALRRSRAALTAFGVLFGIAIAGFTVGHPPKILGIAPAGGVRPDVAAALHLPDAYSTGWTLELPASATQDYEFQAFACDAENGEACEAQSG